MNRRIDYRYRSADILRAPGSRIEKRIQRVTGRRDMACVFAIASEGESDGVLGARYSAVKSRDRLTRQLESGNTVQVDFTGALVTQAFVDELFGPLILRAGPSVLARLIFSGCSDDTRAILNLVIAGRLRDYSSLQARGAISDGWPDACQATGSSGR